MEPIISKLQEGVKYPRFERDATKTINDLVDHITKERGVYSSSIEPNPSEHNVWFNTNDNTLYIYNGNEWETISHNNIIISKDGEFYPYPIINIVDRDISVSNYYADYNKHYVIIVDTDNIRKFLNNIVIAQGYDNGYIIIGDDTNINGTFLVNIYDTYIYYIKLSSSYIKEDNVFYCTEGMLYYNAVNTNHDGEGLNISGFYTKEYLRNIIESYEGISIETLMLNNIFIEPEDDATIIIGKQAFNCDISILGEQLNNANIYMYNNTLHIGNNGDSNTEITYIGWDDVNVYCNCKNLGDITVTHENSSLNMSLYMINFVVGNNNKLIIDGTVVRNIDNCYIYVIKETDNDKSSVYIGEGEMLGGIQEYVNLCGTPLNGSGGISCSTFITTTIDDIDRANSDNSPIDMHTCKTLIIDATYRALTNTGYINYLKTCTDLKVYTTNQQLSNFLNAKGLRNTKVVKANYVTNDYVHIEYKSFNNPIYSMNIYKH